MMYDELVRQMRSCCNGEPCEEANCGFNPKSDLDCIEQLLTKAADAIEELSEQLENETEYATALNSYIPQWIPVTERLPEAAERVLCYCRANIYEVLKMQTSGDWFYDVHHIYMHDFVTHWMPLPKPPEKESENLW